MELRSYYEEKLFNNGDTNNYFCYFSLLCLRRENSLGIKQGTLGT
jgi:hypothetical protein